MSDAERLCPSCGASVPGTGRFCGQCGAPTPGPGDDPTIVAPLPVAPPDPGTPGSPGHDPTRVWGVPAAPPVPTAPPVAPWGAPSARPGPPGPPGAPGAPFSPGVPASYGGWPAPPAGAPVYAPPSYGQPGTWPTAAAPAAPAARGNAPAGVVTLVGAALMLVAVFTPWVRTTVETVSGWTAFPEDAKVVLGLGLVGAVAGILLLAGVRSVALRVVLVAAGAGAIGLTVVDHLSIGSDLPEALNAQFGVGLVLVPVAGFLLVLGGLVARSGRG